MSITTTIRVPREVRDVLGRLAAQRGVTVSAAVTRATRLLEQETIGRDLTEPLRSDERDWLDADAG